MMYVLLGLSISLAALLTLNTFASLLASLVWRLFGTRLKRLSASSCAAIIFLLRILPIVGGIICVVVLLAPAYIAHEPRTAHEDVSLKLAVISAAAAIGLALATFRGLASWRATRRLASDWMRNAEPIDLPQVEIPAYKVEHQFPVIAIVGVMRPRLFIANKVFSSLGPAELAAAIKHEAGHLAVHDNLKRGLMRACRDMLLVPCGRALDREWLEASEAAADEFAAGRGSVAALDLASALVKIARLIPPGFRPIMPAGAFLIETTESGGVRARVNRLVQFADHGIGRKATFKVPIWAPIVLTVVLAATAASEPHVLASVHLIMEHAVHLLS